MFGNRITLFKIFGFPVRLDASWLFLLILLTWSLASSYFPKSYLHFTPVTYWIMGFAGAMGLFFSIIFHELCHSLVAKHYGLPMGGITLFIFGGVAEMEDEPKTPKIEFLMAIAGPVSSIFLSLFFSGVTSIGLYQHFPTSVTAVTGYLSFINLILALFNLVPAFPLDGGRVLRSILWSIKKNIRWATRVASGVGATFANFLIMLGLFVLIFGQFVGGLWWILIGIFLRSAAGNSYQQLLIRRQLEGHPVSQFMRTEPVAIPPNISLEELLKNYFYQFYFKVFPVVEDGKLLGMVNMNQIKEYPQAQWSQITAGQIMTPRSEDNTVLSSEDTMHALSLLNHSGLSRLMVVNPDNQLVGVLSLKDLMEMLSMKIELDKNLDR